MEGIIQFRFRNRNRTANYVVCQRTNPTYIYINCQDADLIKEFGDELVLHVERAQLLTNNIYSDKRLELCSTIFDALTARLQLAESHQSSITNNTN